MNLYAKRTINNKISIWRVHEDKEGFSFQNIDTGHMDNEIYPSLLQLILSLADVEEYFELKVFYEDFDAWEYWVA